MGCGNQTEPRDLTEGISETAKSKITEALGKAGITNAVLGVIQDRGDYWHVVINGCDQMAKFQGNPSAPRKRKQAGMGEAGIPPEFLIYKDGRIQLPPGLVLN